MFNLESNTEQERRNATRAKTLKTGMIAYDKGRCTMSCTILEFSANGARLRPQDSFWVPDNFVLHLPNGTRRHCDVVRKDRTDIAVQYTD